MQLSVTCGDRPGRSTRISIVIHEKMKHKSYLSICLMSYSPEVIDTRKASYHSTAIVQQAPLLFTTLRHLLLPLSSTEFMCLSRRFGGVRDT